MERREIVEEIVKTVLNDFDEEHQYLFEEKILNLGIEFKNKENLLNDKKKKLIKLIENESDVDENKLAKLTGLSAEQVVHFIGKE